MIALVNREMPRTHGDSFVHISKLEFAVRCDGTLYEIEHKQPNSIQLRVAQHVAEFVADGATLQLGIGAIPSRCGAPGAVRSERPGNSHGDVL